MAKSVVRHTIRVEMWNVADPEKRYPSGRAMVNHIAVRDSLGRFHGATNYRGARLS